MRVFRIKLGCIDEVLYCIRHIIHVVNEGMLESSGTHKELLEKSKVYQRLYANEKKEI